MKGVVFTEFIEMVEDTFSPTIADEMIDTARLASEGAYTSVGTYDHAEMVELVTRLSKITGIDVTTLLHKYGEYLFKVFVRGFPTFFEGANSAFDLLKTVDDHIHVEVRKLYPDAELPVFEYEEPADNILIMRYSSPRGFSFLAQGLIYGCVSHYGEEIEVLQNDLSGGHGTKVEFTLTRKV